MMVTLLAKSGVQETVLGGTVVCACDLLRKIAPASTAVPPAYTTRVQQTALAPRILSVHASPAARFHFFHVHAPLRSRSLAASR